MEKIADIIGIADILSFKNIDIVSI